MSILKHMLFCFYKQFLMVKKELKYIEYIARVSKELKYIAISVYCRSGHIHTITNDTLPIAIV